MATANVTVPPVTPEILSLPAHGEIVINEVMYEPAAPCEPTEFIELHNTTDAPINTSGFSFSSGINYTFPAGTTIGAGGNAVQGIAGSTANAG